MHYLRVGTVFLLLGLCLGLNSCRSREQVDATPPTWLPSYHGAVEVAQLAFEEWVRTGAPPDSIERIIRGRRVPEFGGSLVDEGRIRTIESSDYQGDQYYCTYRPLRQYPAMTLKGDVGRRTIGFEVITWWESGMVQIRILGVYGPDGGPMLLVMP